MIPCSKSNDGRHNFTFSGSDCANGCGTNQNLISGRFPKATEDPFKKRAASIMQPKAPKKGIHSALHEFVYELRKEFGETAMKGVGSFSYYLGYINRIGLQEAYRIRAEIRQGNAYTPKKLFWFLVGQELKKRREAKSSSSGAQLFDGS